MSSYLAFQGLSKARQRFADLAKGLREAASGAVQERAAGKVQALIQAVADGWIGRHTDTGAAAGSLVVATSGSLVTLTANRYLSFHNWPFRRGMPPFILKRAGVILAREILSAIGSKGAAGELALDLVNEADAAAAEAPARKAANLARGRAKRIAKKAASSG